MKKKTHILLVVNWPQFFLSHRLSLALHLRKIGHRISIATGPGPGIDVIKQHGFDHFDIPLDAGRMRPERDIFTIFALVHLYRRLRPDLVYHVTNKPILYGTLAARWSRVPRVLNAVSGLGHLFTGGERRTQLGVWMFRTLMRHPNLRVIVQNRDDWQLFKANGLATEDELRLIPGSGVDMREFFSAHVRPTDPVTIIQTSRMIGEKGVREFIAAARIVRQRHANVNFLLVGGEYINNPTSIPVGEIEAAVADGVITWLGNRDDIPALLRQATIYCLPTYREGMPRALIEAAACGLPIITTDTAGCRDIVRDRENGLLIPPRNTEMLVEAIEYMLANPDRAAAMGRQARADVEKSHSLESILAQITHACEELLASSPRPD